jgi:HSP20 family molecular chaperone IbpA
MGIRAHDRHAKGRTLAKCPAAPIFPASGKSGNQAIGLTDVAIKDTERWMFSEACEMLMRAERLHRQLFQPQARMYSAPAWEPPADVLETESHVVIYIALPGVSQDHVEAAIEGAELVIAGVRVLPGELQNAAIHRLELPQGRFERRIALPAGRYNQIAKKSVDGCLVISLRKSA